MGRDFGLRRPGFLFYRVSLKNNRESFAVFLDNVRMRFGVFKDFFAEAILYKFNQLGPGCRADAWARGSERDDEFAIFTHDAERPDGAVKGLVFGF